MAKTVAKKKPVEMKKKSSPTSAKKSTKKSSSENVQSKKAPAKKPEPKKASAPERAKRKFQVTRSVAGGNKNYRAWKDWEAGDEVVGTYSGSHKDQFGGTCRTLTDIKYCSWNHELEGKSLVLNGAGFINYAFGDDRIETGELVQVTYDGMIELESGKMKGKDSHTGQVNIVQDDEAEEEEEDQEEDDDFEEDEDEESEDDEDEDDELEDQDEEEDEDDEDEDWEDDEEEE